MSWEKSNKIRKYRQIGEPLDQRQAIDAILNGDYLIVRGKPMHPSVLVNWSLTTLRCFCGWRAVYRAGITREWVLDQEAKAELDKEFAEAGETA